MSSISGKPHGKLEDKSSSDAHGCSGHSAWTRCLMMDIICSVWVYVNEQLLSTGKGLSTGQNFGLLFQVVTTAQCSGCFSVAVTSWCHSYRAWASEAVSCQRVFCILPWKYKTDKNGLCCKLKYLYDVYMNGVMYDVEFFLQIEFWLYSFFLVETRSQFLHFLSSLKTSGSF